MTTFHTRWIGLCLIFAAMNVGARMLGSVRASGDVLAYVHVDVGIILLDVDRRLSHRFVHDAEINYSTLAWSPDGERLAFTSQQDGDSEIFVASLADPHPRNLSNALGSDYAPAWSPDGEWLVYVSERAGNADVYLVRAADGETHPLAATLRNEYGASWSPAAPSDGGTLAYLTQHEFERYTQLGLIDTSGTSLGSPTLADIGDFSTFWSTNGQQMVFTSAQTGNDDIYLLDTVSGALRNLTNDPAEDHTPFLSPDGQQVAFISLRGGTGDYYLLDLRDDSLRRLTYNMIYSFGADWSPDGTRFAFAGAFSGSSDIYLLDIPGGKPRRLTSGGGNLLPAWRP